MARQKSETYAAMIVARARAHAAAGNIAVRGWIPETSAEDFHRMQQAAADRVASNGDDENDNA